MSFNSGMKGADVVALLKNGLPIVDSVDKLDANAALGSIACVVEAGSASEISFKDLYQPDASIMDINTGTIDTSNCSQVSSIKIISPTTLIPLGGVSISGEQGLYFIPEGASLNGGTAGKMALLAVVPNATLSHVEGAMGMVMDIETSVSQEYVLWTMSDDGVITANQEQIDAFCSEVEGLFYIGDMKSIMMGAGTSIEYLNLFDHFAKAVACVPSKAYIYHKKDSWEELYKKDFEKLAKDLDVAKVATESKADKIPFATYSSWNGLQPNVYTTYSISTTGAVSIKLAAIADTTIYNEYILEIKCITTPSSVAFTDMEGSAVAIKWSNGTAPTFETGFTYMISIVNGFGVYSTFINE